MSKRRKKQIEVSVLPRTFVETIAKIIGPSSAAAAALQKADEIGGPVHFLNAGDSILVIPGGDSIS